MGNSLTVIKTVVEVSRAAPNNTGPVSVVTEAAAAAAVVLYSGNNFLITSDKKKKKSFHCN